MLLKFKKTIQIEIFIEGIDNKIKYKIPETIVDI